MSSDQDPTGFQEARGTLDLLFPTRIYRAELDGFADLGTELSACCLSAAEDDGAGQAWSDENAYPGYTSYASLDDLTWRYPPFQALSRRLDAHAALFADALNWDLGDRALILDSLWINILEPGGFHGAHLHPNSVISGTVYLEVPDGASALRFEDPRLGRMMAVPPRREGAPRDFQSSIAITPQPGTLLMWESWLRHEVGLNRADALRITVSFNYAWR